MIWRLKLGSPKKVLFWNYFGFLVIFHDFQVVFNDFQVVLCDSQVNFHHCTVILHHFEVILADLEALTALPLPPPLPLLPVTSLLIELVLGQGKIALQIVDKTRVKWAQQFPEVTRVRLADKKFPTQSRLSCKSCLRYRSAAFKDFS
jgi:hypothetical protein